MEMEAKYFEFTAETGGMRVDAWLAEKLPEYSRTYLKKLVEDGKAVVNGREVKTSFKLKQGDKVSVEIPPPKKLEVAAEKIDIEILYEDDDIVVVNKPKGMVVHPAAGNYTGTMVNALLEKCGSSLSDINGVIRPGIVHRIDKDTSGVLVVAKNNASHEKLSQLFKKHDIKRMYIALVDGVIKEDEGIVDAPIGRHPTNRKKMSVNTKNGRKAVTRFKVKERYSKATLVELTLETGRTHQIRVHMSHIGHPVIGDPVYGSKKNKFDLEGQALHARLLGFVHPSTGQYVEFEADPPEYFKKLIDKLSQM